VLEAKDVPASSEEPALAGQPAAGDRVRLKDFPAPGTVLAVLDNDEVEVEVGRVHMRVPKTAVQVVARKAPESGRRASREALSRFELRAQQLGGPEPEAPAGAPAGAPAEAASDRQQAGSETAAEINVIGETAEEARERVDKFLDGAFLSGQFKVRVVHGMGKGILKKTLHEMFASHPHVEKFYSALQQEGGQGATIVELRK
jgi:DNA mismatch repair protein MutS2